MIDAYLLILWGWPDLLILLQHFQFVIHRRDKWWWILDENGRFEVKKLKALVEDFWHEEDIPNLAT